MCWNEIKKVGYWILIIGICSFAAIGMLNRIAFELPEHKVDFILQMIQINLILFGFTFVFLSELLGRRNRSRQLKDLFKGGYFFLVSAIAFIITLSLTPTPQSEIIIIYNILDWLKAHLYTWTYLVSALLGILSFLAGIAYFFSKLNQVTSELNR